MPGMQITATVTLTDEEGDAERLEHAIAQEGAKVLLEKVEEELLKEIKATVRETIRERVSAIVDQAVTQSIQKTNSWGEATGGMTTLREVILADANKYLRERVESDGRTVTYQNDRNPTRLAWMVQAEARKAIGEAIKAEVNTAAVAVRAEMEGQVESLIGEAVKKIIGLK